MNLAANERLERLLGRILGWGALTSTVLLTAGLLLQLLGVAPSVFTALMHAGLIALIATPVARVVVSVIEYALDRDWLFMTLTTLVLIILLGSLAVATR